MNRLTTKNMMRKPPTDHPTLQAAEYWRDRCLLDMGAVFTEQHLWTSENILILSQNFANHLTTGQGDFFSQLEQQLKPESKAVKQLVSEMIWVIYLFPVPQSLRLDTKIKQIHQVWGWSGEPFPTVSFHLEESLRLGIGHPGAAYNTSRWSELLFFIQMMAEWAKLDHVRRKELLADPWNWAQWVQNLQDAEKRQLRHIFLYLLFPNHFEPFSTNSIKRKIVRNFTLELGEDPTKFDNIGLIELDRKILDIRKKLHRRGAPIDFDFHDNSLINIWRPSDEYLNQWYLEKFGKAKVWAIGEHELEMSWDEFQEKGFVAIKWDALGDLRAFSSRKDIHEKLSELSGKVNPRMDSLACFQFAHEMQPGDYVIFKKKGSHLLGFGVVQSDYKFIETRTKFRHVRQVKWEKTGNWKIPDYRRITTKTLTDFGKYKGTLRFVFQLMEGPNQDDAPFTEEHALKDVFLSKSKFDNMIDALNRKKNVVLVGPPGVGKTFIAKRLAYSMIGFKAPDSVKMIQFHQSYAYEDFIQGFRPSESGGFDLRNGVFHSFCREATKHPENRYVFIIDEINRGNLSKIFGEIMMLIEADKRGSEYAVPLTYSSESKPFFVPENLFLIGMMNTADRSLAMVDYALRRRFAFIRLSPEFASDQFGDFLSEKGVSPELIQKIKDRILDLNAEIRDDHANLGPDFEIGHSFFCPGSAAERLDESWYRNIIHQEIEPLLQEYWFDKPDRVQQHMDLLLG